MFQKCSPSSFSCIVNAFELWYFWPSYLGDDRDWLIANVCALGSAHMHIELVLAEMVQLAAINMIIPLRK